MSKKEEATSAGAPVAPEEEGNTTPPPLKKDIGKRCNAARHWAFTYWGRWVDPVGGVLRRSEVDPQTSTYDYEHLNEFIEKLKDMCYKFSFQEEQVEGKDRHLQGAITLKKKGRPFEHFREMCPTIHWEPMHKSSTVEQLYDYTYKYDTKVMDGLVMRYNMPRLLNKVKWEDLPSYVQMYISPIIDAEYDFRTIHWVVDLRGNWGKSLLQKYLVDNHKAIMVAGGGKDIACCIKMYHDDRGYWPDYVLCNIPRSTDEKYISYGMLEQVKDGLVFSAKYESSMLRFPPVKLIVFANMYPGDGCWSDDRVQLHDCAKDKRWTEDTRLNEDYDYQDDPGFVEVELYER